MKKLNIEAQKPFQSAPAEGTLCFSQFSYDGQWYRAKVKSVRGDEISVVYIDFGNSEDVSLADLRQVSKDDITKQLFQIAPQAKLVNLAFIAPEQYNDDVFTFLSDKTLDKDLFAVVEYEQTAPEQKQFISLFTNSDATGNIQTELIKRRYARVNIPETLKEQDQNGWLKKRTLGLIQAERK